MKKTLLLILSGLISLICFGQPVGTLKFLGIPIDGTEKQFSAKLISKGFSYSSLYDSYKGQFNGKSVDVYIHTNHDLVDRVYVAFPLSTKENVRVEYNILLNQFNQNGKYINLSFSTEIPDKEDISYEILVNNKRYQASFSYFDPDRDQVKLCHDLFDKLSDCFTKEQLDIIKEYADKALLTTGKEQDDLVTQMLEKMQNALVDNGSELNAEQSLIIMSKMLDGMRTLADGDVWFMIHENSGKYQIGLYYDNLHNIAHGEDL